MYLYADRMDTHRLFQILLGGQSLNCHWTVNEILSLHNENFPTSATTKKSRLKKLLKELEANNLLTKARMVWGGNGNKRETRTLWSISDPPYLTKAWKKILPPTI